MAFPCLKYVCVGGVHSGFATGLVPQGGYSHFFFIRRLGPSIYCLPPKNIGNVKKIFVIFATPKNILILYIYLKKKTQKYIEKTPKTVVQFCDDSKKNIHKIFITYL